MADMRAPASTYRLQMTAEFGFDAAREVVPYLHRLGVTDAYLSPILRAAPGSTHGYDVVDPTMLDPRLGTRAEFDALSNELRAHDMGLLLDIVPNHMAASTANPWWRDVLEHGEGSKYAGHFDIDWSANEGRLLLPVLGGALEQVLEAGELSVDGEELAYYDHRWPLAPGSADAADIREVVAAQHYELADWREQARRLNYRRFFDITDLVGVRVEQPHVFDDVHRLLLELVAEGRVTGVRVDHVDGLLDPRGYLEQLQAALREASGQPDEAFYVVVEKILAPHEPLPETWPIAGTTGYEFLDVCDGLFVDPHGAEQVAEVYADVAESRVPFDEVVAQAKLRIVREYFWGELGRLARHIAGADSDEERRLRDAIAVVTAQLPVYRTYVDEHGRTPADTTTIERALADAAAVEGVDALALARVAEALRTDTEFTMRWQQFSGPVTAKSVEDTAFYRYWAVPARNEVGAHPSHPSTAIGTFHWLAAERAAHWAGSLNASSTHDTKRSEDVRARMLVLTEEPTWWANLVERWLDELDAPDRTDGWMVASTLVGAWPVEPDRLEAYVRKALREEKLRTRWTDPDEAYEASVIGFGERLRASGEVEAVVERIAERARRNSLAATALRLFAPGVPDIYQGSEVEFLALVDPDNRRPVDFTRLDGLLDGEGSGPEGSALDKLQIVAAGLRARRDDSDLFRLGAYVPVRIDAPGTLAFARRHEKRWALAAVALPGFVAGSQSRIELPEEAPRTWRNIVTGERIEIAESPIGELLEQLAGLWISEEQGDFPARRVESR
ncbi:MAG: malto-oligosyltrehalose synthase [Thermoleophilia bacterium]|nr:malto-oligosyltrehalose synthase [Thermoleophilia bacterium]